MRQDTSVDLADVLACVLFVGAGLTSLLWALWPMAADDHADDATTLVEVALAEEGSRPDELLIAGVGLEGLLIDGLPDVQRLTEVPLRLAPNDAPVTTARGQYWVLSLANRSPKTPPGYEERTIKDHNGLTLIAWEATGRTQTTRLSDIVQSARAKYVGADDKNDIACTSWRFGRLFCGPNPWNWVGATEAPISGRPQRCVWAHPLNGYDLEITFPRVDMRGAFDGGYGFADSAIGDGNASPVTFRVVVAGEEQVKRVLPSRKGWNRFTIPPNPDHKEETTLSFFISAPQDGKRHFCFDGEIRPVPED